MADAVRDYAAGALGRGDLERQFAILERRARRDSPAAEIERTADLRYRGQSYELNVPWNPQEQIAGAARAFHREHARVYGYATPEREIEIVTIRLRARQRLAKPKLTRGPYRKGPTEIRRVWVEGGWRKIPALPRAEVSTRRAAGPALILDYGSTTLVPPGWWYRNDRSGNLLITA